MASLTLEQFKVDYLGLVAAFNRGDLVTAFAGLADDCEFRTPEDMPDQPVLIGRDRVIAFFQELFEALGNWRLESVRILQATDDVFVCLDRVYGSGQGSGGSIGQELASVSEVNDLMVVRVHQFASWEEGLRASGLDPSVAADAHKVPRGAST